MRSVAGRVVKFLLGSDQPAFVASAACVSLVLGNLIIVHAIYFSTRPSPPLWQSIGAGLAIGLFLMPAFFVTVARASLLMSPWEALATLTAAFLCPLVLWRLGALGINPFLVLIGCMAFVVAAFLTARMIVKRYGRPL